MARPARSAKHPASAWAVRRAAYTRAEYVALLATLALLVALQLAGPNVRAALRYERADVASGQLWRLLTAHFVHFDAAHLLMNAAALIVVWMLFVQLATLRQWCGVVLLSALVVTSGLYVFQTDVDWYLGLSGLLHGLWMAGALLSWKREGRSGALAFGLLVGKLGFEQVQAPLTAALLPSMAVIASAHVFGAMAGSIVLALPSRRPG